MSALLTLGLREECLGVVLSLLVGEPPSDALSSTTGGRGDPEADQAMRALLFWQHLGLLVMLDQRCLCNALAGCEFDDHSMSVPCTSIEGFPDKGTRHGPPPAVA